MPIETCPRCNEAVANLDRPTNRYPNAICPLAAGAGCEYCGGKPPFLSPRSRRGPGVSTAAAAESIHPAYLSAAVLIELLADGGRTMPALTTAQFGAAWASLAEHLGALEAVKRFVTRLRDSESVAGSPWRGL